MWHKNINEPGASHATIIEAHSRLSLCAFPELDVGSDTLTATYDSSTGEPRGLRSKKSDYKTAGLGTRVDCQVRVQVCPTGIDIRSGLHNGCNRHLPVSGKVTQ